jgi:hypothetical protein
MYQEIIIFDPEFNESFPENVELILEIISF